MALNSSTTTYILYLGLERMECLYHYSLVVNQCQLSSRTTQSMNLYAKYFSGGLYNTGALFLIFHRFLSSAFSDYLSDYVLDDVHYRSSAPFRRPILVRRPMQGVGHCSENSRLFLVHRSNLALDPADNTSASNQGSAPLNLCGAIQQMQDTALGREASAGGLVERQYALKHVRSAIDLHVLWNQVLALRETREKN